METIVVVVWPLCESGQIVRSLAHQRPGSNRKAAFFGGSAQLDGFIGGRALKPFGTHEQTDIQDSRYH